MSTVSIISLMRLPVPLLSHRRIECDEVRITLILISSVSFLHAAGGVDPSTLDNKVLVGDQGGLLVRRTVRNAGPTVTREFPPSIR